MKKDVIKNEIKKRQYPAEWSSLVFPLYFKLTPKYITFLDAFIENHRASNPLLFLGILHEIVEKLPKQLWSDFLPLLNSRGGAALFAEKLAQNFTPESVITKIKPSVSYPPSQRVWELIGGYYLNHGRYHEALPIYYSLYNHMLLSQDKLNKWVHKGMPLVWISDCFKKCGFDVLAKRYLMLTLCEDAILGKGNVSADKTGVYYRLVWGGGLSDAKLKNYSQSVYDLYRKKPKLARFPEWILQGLDQDWMTEFPSPAEASVYIINRLYVDQLISGLGDGSGRKLELLSEYMLACMPGCRTKQRQRSASTDYDIICSIDGFDIDFRSELGRYFVCECKDWNKPADFTALSKFCRILDSTKSRFGIFFSKKGISGLARTTDAAREQLKVFQDRGMVIVVINEQDLIDVAMGQNFINLLRSKYEKVRLDLT